MKNNILERTLDYMWDTHKSGKPNLFNERMIKNHLGISREKVREILAVLKEKGLINIISGRLGSIHTKYELDLAKYSNLKLKSEKKEDKQKERERKIGVMANITTIFKNTFFRISFFITGVISSDNIITFFDEIFYLLTHSLQTLVSLL